MQLTVLRFNCRHLLYAHYEQETSISTNKHLLKTHYTTLRNLRKSFTAAIQWIQEWKKLFMIAWSQLCAYWQKLWVIWSWRKNQCRCKVLQQGRNWTPLGVHSRDRPKCGDNRYSKRATGITWTASSILSALLHSAALLLLHQDVWCWRLQDLQATKASLYCFWEAQFFQAQLKGQQQIHTKISRHCGDVHKWEG